MLKAFENIQCTEKWIYQYVHVHVDTFTFIEPIFVYIYFTVLWLIILFHFKANNN